MADDARRQAVAAMVGRDVELARFRTVLAEDRSAVMWVFGPGGIGKSTLCRAVAAEGERVGRHVTTVDLRAIEPSRAAITAALSVDGSGDGMARHLVVIDAFERISGLEVWVQSDLLDLLPAGTVVVVASRHPPSAAWRDDPGWSSLLEPIALRALSAEEGVRVLTGGGVPSDVAAETAPAAHGHPLALVLLAEILQRDEGRADAAWGLAPDLVASLLGRILDEVPTPDHRRLLDAAAMTRVVTRGLVRHLFPDGDPDALFEWLRHRSFVEELPDGLCPHDLVRDALEGELRRTDPDAYATLHHEIRAHLLAGRDRPGGAAAASQGIVFLHRNSSLMSSQWEWATFGAVEATGIRPGDDAQLEAIAVQHNDEAEIPILHHWIERQPEAFTVVRSPTGEVLGFLADLLLDAPTDDDLAIDPTVAAVWAHASRNDPPRPGQVIGVHRYFEDRDRGQSPSVTFNVVSWTNMKQWISVPALSWSYIAVVRDPDLWGPMMSYIDFHPVRDATHDVGHITHHVYCHDWRRTDPDRWLDLMEARELGGAITPIAPAPVLVALARDDFDHAVKTALRDLARPDQLAANPLTRSRLVRDHAVGEGDADLAVVLRAALQALPDDPRTAKARRALDRTFFHGAVTQEAAAEVLGMAFSTYRRHLQAGTALLTDMLWRWELFGSTAD